MKQLASNDSRLQGPSPSVAILKEGQQPTCATECMPSARGSRYITPPARIVRRFASSQS